MSLSAKATCCLALLIYAVSPLDIFSQASTPSSTGNPARRIHPYTGTLWTTITQPLANGSTRTVTQRTEISQDAQGKWTKTYYRATNGVQYDVSAPVDHTDSGTMTQAHASLAPSISNGEALVNDEDLGVRLQNGLETQGRRRTFRSVGRQPEALHIFETWYSPILGIVVHSENHNFNGTIVISELTNLQLGSVAGQ